MSLQDGLFGAPARDGRAPHTAPAARTAAPDRIVTWALRLGGIGLLGAVLATALFAFGLLRTRPVMPGEAEVLFEAARMHRSLPLFANLHDGALEYGSYPSRFYVLYPPVWSWVISHVPEALTQPLTRFVCTLAWFGVLATLAHRAAPRCRSAAIAGALYVAGIYVLANFATTARPDAIAVGLAAIALDRCVRRRQLEPLSIALFCVAAVLKPNVMGALLGVIAVDAFASPRRALWNLLVAALVIAGFIDVLELASGGVWHEHFARSFGQPLSAAAAAHTAIQRLPLLGALIGTCAWLAWRERRRPGPRLALGALAGAFAWACFAFARPGSASNYWLETSAVCVVILAHVPLPAMASLGYRRRAQRLAAIAFAAQALYSCGASWDGVVESFERLTARAQLARFARETCIKDANDVVVSDEPGFELEANGRILSTVFTMNSLARAGKYPTAAMVDDAKRLEVRCVMSTHGEFDAFLPEVGDVFRDRFRFVKEESEWRLYARR